MTRLVIVLSGLLAASMAATDSINKDLVVTSCDRTIDMSTQLVKMSQGAVKSFLFSFDLHCRCRRLFHLSRQLLEIMTRPI